MKLSEVFSAHQTWRGKHLILHAGANKTGTTSLQFYCDGSRELMRARGFLYPVEGTNTSAAPKHQWIVHQLHFAKDEELFARQIQNCMAEGDPSIHTLVLSTEGIFNHWWDFDADAKALFHLLANFFDVSIFLWLRQPTDYYRSFYLQNLKNPRVPSVQAYGHDLSASEMLSLGWVKEHLRYPSIIEDMSKVFGAERVYTFSYKNDTVVDFCDLLGFSHPPAIKRENASSLSELGVEMLRVMNRVDLGERKRAAYSALVTFDGSLASTPFTLDPSVERTIERICPLTDADLTRLDKLSRAKWASRKRPVVVHEVGALQVDVDAYPEAGVSGGAGTVMDVLVVGMHRSGTSALAGTLQRLGYRVPEPQLETTPDNPAGFYENALVRDFNEHVLDLAVSSWHDPLPVSISRLAAHRADLDARLLALLRSDEFLAPCLLKDPRFCVSVDLWLDGLARCGREAGCILMARHPAAVAASLRARNGLSIAHSLTLWLKYMLSAEELTRGRLRTVVVYDDLLRDWRGTVGRALAALGLDPVAEADGRPVDAFLCGDLRHHSDPDDFGAHNALEQACLATWRCFQALAADGEDGATLQRLSDLRARYAESVSLLTPLLDGLLDRRTVVPTNQPGFDGMRLRTADKPDVWLVYHGERHRIASPEVYQAFFTGVDAVGTVDSVAGIEAGSPLADGACLIRAEGRDAIYLVNRGEAHAVLRHHIASYRTFIAFGFDPARVRDVPKLVLDTVPEGRDIRVPDW